MRALHPLAPASGLAPAGAAVRLNRAGISRQDAPAVPPAGGLRAVPQAAPAVPPSGGREPDTAGMAAHRGLARGPHEPQRPGHLARLSPVRAPRYRQSLRGRRDDRPAGTRPSGRTPERRDGGPTSHRARDAHPRHADCGSRMRSTPGAALPIDLAGRHDTQPTACLRGRSVCRSAGQPAQRPSRLPRAVRPPRRHPRPLPALLPLVQHPPRPLGPRVADPRARASWPRPRPLRATR